MASITDVIAAYQAAQPKGKVADPAGPITTEASLFDSTPGGELASLTVKSGRYNPAPITLPTVTTSDDPFKPGGVDEVLSVTQTAGAAVNYTPIDVRTYNVRGQVI